MDFIDCFDFNKQTSLYVHIPFCYSKCSYCAFYSVAHCEKKIKEQYTKRLVSEIETVAQAMNGKPFYTAYIGGGNPGCLEVGQLESVAKAICKNGRPEEFTVEMNPESLDSNHYFLFKQYFTRISMGIQSLQGKALLFLGRNADTESTMRGLKKVSELKKETGIRISFDLITCLPEWHDYLSDVRAVVDKYNPDHLSVYALTLEEGTPLYEKHPVLPDSDKQSGILKEIWNYLESRGYEHYEVSNFAKNGCKSLHNSVYWNYRQYVGLGCGASSTGFPCKTGVRIEFPYDLNGYAFNEPFSGYKVSELAEYESLEELVLMGLRHTEGLDLNRIKNEYGIDFHKSIEGFDEVNNHLVPDDCGLMISDWAACEIIGSIDSRNLDVLN